MGEYPSYKASPTRLVCEAYQLLHLSVPLGIYGGSWTVPLLRVNRPHSRFYPIHHFGECYVPGSILYIANLKKSIKLLELINEFSKVTGCKNHIQKSIVFLYSNSKQTEIILRKQCYLQ